MICVHFYFTLKKHFCPGIFDFKILCVPWSIKCSFPQVHFKTTLALKTSFIITTVYSALKLRTTQWRHTEETFHADAALSLTSDWEQCIVNCAFVLFSLNSWHFQQQSLGWNVSTPVALTEWNAQIRSDPLTFHTEIWRKTSRNLWNLSIYLMIWHTVWYRHPSFPADIF